MIDLPTGTLLAAAAIVARGYVVYGLTGFGSSIVAVPLLALLFPLRFAVPIERMPTRRALQSVWLLLIVSGSGLLLRVLLLP